nr:hypothetical protein [Bradyrhizobium centrolobii]
MIEEFRGSVRRDGAFFDEPTNTESYLVADPATKKAAIIDPVFELG